MKYKSGELICDIAKKFGTSVEKIVNMNQLTNSDFLQAGDIIRVR